MTKMEHTDITIIGGGVSGITTALTLQLLGFDTVCYAEQIADEQAPADARFASLYPAASVIPHSVGTDRMDELFPPSQQVFNFLYQQNAPFMQLHRHYEVYEFPREDPPYADSLVEYKRIEMSEDPLLPRYSHDVSLSGWSFNCLVAEWPGYLSQLYRWYREAGGVIIQQKITRKDIDKLKCGVVINCSGIWTSELFEEAGPSVVERGHLLFIRGAPLVTRPDGTIISYNYTADPKIYSDPCGNPSDVYFYPRRNGWILGGSRQRGTIDAHSNFEGKEYTDSVTLDGVSVPRPILELNKKILNRTFNITMDGQWRIEPKIGYRFIGSQNKQRLRLDHTETLGKKIIHNYGHGGAGVTLSWGCALETGRMIRQAGIDPHKKADDFRSVALNQLQNVLSDLAWK